MRINGSIENSGNLPEQKLHRRVDSAEAHKASTATPGKSGAQGIRSHLPSPKVADMQLQLQTFPEVRSEVVAAVANRVAAGELSGFDVALRTAAAMLNG